MSKSANYSQYPQFARSLEYDFEKDLAFIVEHAGDKVVIVDDLIATGGTAAAAAKLVELVGAEVIECCFVIDLPDLGGRRRLSELGIASHALCAFEGH